MAERLIKHFNPILIVIVLAGIVANMYLFYAKQNLTAQLQANQKELAFTQADNHNLANQLENAQIQAEIYKKQIDALNQKVLLKMQQEEERNNEIVKALESAQKWALTPVPVNVSKLLNNRNSALSNTKTESSHVPNASDVPSTKGSN